MADMTVTVTMAAEEFVESAGGFSFSGTQHSPGIVHFDDMVYSRPDLDALRADILKQILIHLV